MNKNKQALLTTLAGEGIAGDYFTVKIRNLTEVVIYDHIERLSTITRCENETKAIELAMSWLTVDNGFGRLSLNMHALENIGLWLAQSRKEAGLTQTELSARSGIMRQAISAIERGHNNATIATVGALVTAIEGVSRG